MPDGPPPEHYRRRDDVRYRIVDREAVILRQSVAENLVLNEVGSSILSWLDAGCSVSEILDKLPQEYDVGRDQLVEDLPVFLRELEEAGVVEPVTPSR